MKLWRRQDQPDRSTGRPGSSHPLNDEEEEYVELVNMPSPAAALPQPMGSRKRPLGARPTATDQAVADIEAEDEGEDRGDSVSAADERASWTDREGRALEGRQAKIERLRIAEEGSGEYDDEAPKKRRFVVRLLAWLLLIVILTGGGAVAGWHFWLRHETPDKSQQSNSAPPAAPPASDTGATKSHESTVFQLKLDYPENWRLGESENRLTITSTPLQLRVRDTNDTYRTQAGQVIVTIQRKQTSLPALASGPGTSVRESERVEYSRPSQDQRGATYVTYLAYPQSAKAEKLGIDAIYVSGDNGYQADQLVPASDLLKADPLISVSFRHCNDDQCDKPGQPVTLATDAWNDQKLSKPVLDIIRSIVVQ